MRERNSGEILLFTVIDRADKPSEINFFYGKDDKGRVDMDPSTININNLTLPTDGGKSISNFSFATIP